MNGCVAAERRAGNLAAAVGNHLVDVHVELGAAARHPHMQRKHVMMLACQDFVAGLNDQFATLIIEPLAGIVGESRGLLQRRVGRDHFARNKILADAEMLEGTLRLSTPQLVSGHFHDAEAVSLFSHVGHPIPPCYITKWTKEFRSSDGARLRPQALSDTSPDPTMVTKRSAWCRQFLKFMLG